MATEKAASGAPGPGIYRLLAKILRLCSHKQFAIGEQKPRRSPSRPPALSASFTLHFLQTPPRLSGSRKARQKNHELRTSHSEAFACRSLTVRIRFRRRVAKLPLPSSFSVPIPFIKDNASVDSPRRCNSAPSPATPALNHSCQRRQAKQLPTKRLPPVPHFGAGAAKRNNRREGSQDVAGRKVRRGG